MKNNKVLTVCLALSLGAGYAFARPSLQDDETTPLQESMQGLMSRRRAMRKLVRDPAAHRSELLEILEEFRGHALTAFSLPPTAPGSLERTDAALWRVGFQRQILTLIDTGLECELAVLKGDTELLGEAYKTLSSTMKAGHDRYKKSD